MQGSKLYVGNLNYSVTPEELKQLFSQYGVVTDIKLFEDKGFGFVEMGNQSEAEQAKSALDGSDLKGRPLKVDEARQKKQSDRRRPRY